MIKVLVVDDSAVVREVLSAGLRRSADIEVVGAATDPYDARAKIVKFRPDVITLDIEMPRMDGLTFLAKLMKYYPLPVIIVSSLNGDAVALSVRALELGALDVIQKPVGMESLDSLSATLIEKVHLAAHAKVGRSRHAAPSSNHLKSLPMADMSQKVVAIGASVGGTEAIRSILATLPVSTAGIVIVQHMPEKFVPLFAQRLNELCEIEVRVAVDGDILKPGLALVSPGNRHLVLHRMGNQYRARINDGPPIQYHRPSVDVLFQSVAKQAGNNAVGVLLTGMGADGAKGLLAMHQAGARTIAQDEKTCVVFGMPKEAIRLGAADVVTPLGNMPLKILDALNNRLDARPHAE